ncbi:MAG: hypothetical protein L3J98_01485 [Gammaproteobacteria bacterium]|nr:hypothetical protein [Gammaproteobacteria bacterium]MCF6258828.1 hypothetical protein [Gammaproteobacteria bacterium]
MITEGTVFSWGNNQKAVVVKALDEASGIYYCVYHQNGYKYVVSEFLFYDGSWSISDESGREIKASEWPQYVSKLKSIA